MHPILDPGPAILAEAAEVVEYSLDLPLDEAYIRQAAEGCVGIVSQLMDPIRDGVLSTPGLKIVSNVAVGFDNIDVPAATAHKVMVTNTPGVLDDATADFAFTLVMATARRVVEADYFARSGKFKGWAIDMILGADVFNATLGIIGIGRIGRGVAHRAKGFNMRVLYYDPQGLPPDAEQQLGATRVELPRLLAESDFVSVHVPLTPETQHLLSTPQFGQMKKTAILINTSRGPGIDGVACTGRPLPGARPWVLKLNREGPIVCYQGAQVRALNGDVILDHGIAHDLAMEVIRFARELNLHVQAYRDDQLLVERDRPEAHEYAGHAGMEIHVVGDFDEAMGPTTPKLVIVAASATLEALLPQVRRRWAGRLNAATSMPTYLEFTSLESDKATALQFLCDRMGVAQAESVAVGDGRNDASMLAWAGLGVAIEGSPEEVQAAEDRTIPGPCNGGIKHLADLLLRS